MWFEETDPQIEDGANLIPKKAFTWLYNPVD